MHHICLQLTWDRVARHRVHMSPTCLFSSKSHPDTCIVGLPQQYQTSARQGLKMVMIEEYVGPDASYAIWQTIAHYLGGQNLASIRAVCRMSRRAVDDAVKVIALSKEAMQCAMPRQERFPACKQYTFVDSSEDLPQYVRQNCCPPSNQTSVLVCGEACWKAFDLQEWLHSYRDQLLWVGLVLRLCEEHQAEDISVYLQRILAIGSGLQLTLLGLWSEREGGIVLSTDILWAQPVAKIQDIKELYAEFVHIDVAVLQGCAALNRLHLVFDEWVLRNVQCLGAIETLHTLCLEADAVESLERHTLYELGQHIRVLRLLGSAASLSIMEVSDWKVFLFTLFETLGSLECFETTRDARALVHAASMQSQQEEQGRACNGLIIWRFWHLYVVVDRHSSALRGVLRSRNSVGLLHKMSVN